MHEVSAAALRAMLAQETAEVFLPCLTIAHPDLDAPILLVYNTEILHRTAGDFMPYPFQINLPTQSDEEVGTVTLTADNTDLEVNRKIRALVGQPTVTLEIVLASSPNVVEAGPLMMRLLTITGDASTLRGTLGTENDIFSQLVPGQQYLPPSSPGLFT